MSYGKGAHLPPRSIYPPCPHCGTPRKPCQFDVTETTAVGWHMGCPNPSCMATGPQARTKEQAIAKDLERITWPTTSSTR